MGALGKLRVQHDFSAAQMVDRVTQTYEQLLNRQEKLGDHY
jgi:hypothetical protein